MLAPGHAAVCRGCRRGPLAFAAMATRVALPRAVMAGLRASLHQDFPPTVTAAVGAGSYPPACLPFLPHVSCVGFKTHECVYIVFSSIQLRTGVLTYFICHIKVLSRRAVLRTSVGTASSSTPARCGSPAPGCSRKCGVCVCPSVCRRPDTRSHEDGRASRGLLHGACWAHARRRGEGRARACRPAHPRCRRLRIVSDSPAGVPDVTPALPKPE